MENNTVRAKLTSYDLELLEQKAIAESRVSFFAYRRYIHPKLKINWFVFDLCNHLQQFYDDLMAGKRPKLAISAPPQHGKSTAVVDFITWVAGHQPDKRHIYTSFSDRLGVRANLGCQRIFDSSRFKKVFPDFHVPSPGAQNNSNSRRNSELIEFIDREGSFRNTTVRGSITGESLDIGYIDDPLKGRETANSKTIRESTWEWLTDDFMTRFSDDAGMLFIMTRWHVDDPLSRMQNEIGDDLKVVNYPAIAEIDETYRRLGEPLFADLKSLDFLNNIKKIMPAPSWASLYQGSPKILSGNIIPTECFRRYTILPRIEYRIIYADTAQKTAERNDWSVFECWGKGYDGNLYLLDLNRGKWTAPELKKTAKDFWNKHQHFDFDVFGQLREMKVEDKSSGTGLIQEIASDHEDGQTIPITPIPRDRDKYTRVLDVVPTISSGYVYIPENAPWVSDFIKECDEFQADDSHMFDDQIDPMCDAIVDMGNMSAMNIWSQLGK